MTGRWPIAWMPAKAFGGFFATGRPRGVVIHCTESDNTPGMAEGLSGPGWFGGVKAGTSVHRVVDQDSIVQGVLQGTVAYGVGPKGNGLFRQYEMCGRAGWSAAKWREPAQLAMLRGAAPYIADDLREMGSRPRWLSLAQVAAGVPGMLTHNDVRLALGGTTHSDPGPNFPYAELLQYVTEAYDGTAPAAPATKIEEDNAVKLLVYRNDPNQRDEKGRAGDGAIALAGPGIWWLCPSPAYYDLTLGLGFHDGVQRSVAPNVFAFASSFWTQSERNDEVMLAALARLSADPKIPV